MFKNLKINTKLIAIFLLIGLIPLGLVGISTLNTSTDALEGAAFNQLSSLRDVKKGQIEKFFGEREGDMGVLTETVGTLRLEAFNKLMAVQAIKKNQIETFFGERLGDAQVLANNPYTIQACKDLGKANNAAKTKGLSGLGLLQDAKFSLTYETYKPTFENYMEEYGYYDVFLVDPNQGDVFFSVTQEPDFGTVLSREGTSLTSAWEKCLTSGAPALADMAQYAPSNNVPAMFVACPVFDGREAVGAVALQISTEAINNIMQERSGMGESGECYLVGSDLKMRSNSYLDPTNHSISASLNGSVAQNGVDTKAGRESSTGNSGMEVIQDYNDNPVLSVYSPVEIGDVTWGCIAEIDAAEAFCPKDENGTYFFQKYQEMYGYYDLFLINPDGYCFYTVAKEADYQTNFLSGQYSSSNLGALVRNVSSTKGFGFADFAPYAPSNGDPCAFVAQPCTYNGKVEMIVALQLPLDAVNSIMQERAGLGETGETYLIGSDKLMRSDSYLDQTGHSVSASFAGTVDRNGVDTDASRDALSGNTDSKIIIDYNGNPVLSSYAPLDVFGTRWAIIAEIDESEAFAAASSMQTSTITIAVIMIALIVVVGWFFARSISKPISNMAEIAQGISTGDINHTVNVTTNDEIGVLGKSFTSLIDYMKELAGAAEKIAENDLTIDIDPKSEQDVLGHSFKTMTTNLTGMVRQMGDNSTQLVSAATEVASASEQMSRGAKDQTDQVTQVSTAVEEMTATIVESARNAGDATEGANAASQNATNGGQIVNETIQGMQRIADVVRESAESIAKLAASADQIGEIIGVIDDIADQTNLLALNAAIEAARAGEQGRGFAVVADEVRKLAERTGKATGEITGMIKGIQQGTEEAVGSMETGVQEVDQGRVLADKAGNSLTEIVNMSQSVMDQIQQMATASEEQSSAAEQISKNIENVASIARESATGAEQSATAAEELNRQAEGMQQMVARFKVKQEA
ncbi:MAG: HAMP domain-containing protein [candidate division Zixibacteria bacterium]|nr:HAMP domain-containing protein [candidate division Zixibacteria bacterium]